MARWWVGREEKSKVKVSTVFVILHLSLTYVDTFLHPCVHTVLFSVLST